MKKQRAIDHFGSVIEVAKALGITRSAVYQWAEDVPYISALHIERLTNGRLRAGPLPKPGEAERRAG